MAVLNSLTSASGQRTYDHAIREFVAWYCSEPRLAFNRTVVLRYRIHLEQRGYAPATINLRLAAVRRIAYEAADAGLLSPELAAGIRRGARGCDGSASVRLELVVPEQRADSLECAVPDRAQGRDHASSHVDPLRPATWVKPPWTLGRRCRDRRRAGVPSDQQSRARLGRRGTPKALWDVVRTAPRAGIDKLAPHDLRRTCARLCRSGGELDQIQLDSATSPSDDGAQPQMQAEAPDRRERPIGNRT